MSMSVQGTSRNCAARKARTRSGHGNREQAAPRMVAQFRVTHDRWAGDSPFTVLLDPLIQDSGEFRRWWQAHAVRVTASGHKSVHHPKKGALQVEHTSVQANDDPALKPVIYTPV